MNDVRKGRLRSRLSAVGVAVAATALTVLPGLGAVERLEVVSRGPIAGGRGFGLVGPYEKIVGRAHYSLDPSDPANAAVIDLDKAPRGPDGRVHVSGDFHVIHPVDPARGNGTLLVEVPSSGRKRVISLLDRGATPAADPTTAAELGDAFLLRSGFTLAWIGWQYDVADDPELMTLDTVYATAAGQPLEGFVRADRVFDEEARTMPLGHRGDLSYPVADPGHGRNVLTVRSAPLAARRVIPRARWTFGRWEGGRVVPDRRAIVLFGGFSKGEIYEAVYVAERPAVVGLGLTAVRDMTSYLKHDPNSPTKVQRAIGFGEAQTGRFLRHFLYQGFNVDEQERQVFDGVIAHGAGAGRGSFNHRFAQPARDAQAFSSFFYPTDLFPFTGATQQDPVTSAADGLLARLTGRAAAPKVFFTNTSYDYWGRAASLTHTTVEGDEDAQLLPTERIYTIAGAQQVVDPFPPERVQTLLPTNPADFRYVLRALLVAMQAWVADGIEPPPNRMPTVAARTLVPPISLAFPLLRGVPIPRDPHQAYRIDFGPRFAKEGVIDWQPPRVGQPFPARIPQVGPDGNETDGIRLPEIAVPLATYMPWNWRAEEIGGTGQLVDFRGGFLPFPLTREQQDRRRDPRAPIAARYSGRGEFVGRYAEAAVVLVKERLLLAEDLPELIDHAGQLWDTVTSGQVDAGPRAAATNAR